MQINNLRSNIIMVFHLDFKVLQVLQKATLTDCLFCKVAKIIRNKVLVNDLFSCQSTSERLPFSWFGINPFTCLKWEGVFGGCFFKISWKNFLQTKKPPIFLVIEVNRRRVEIFIILVYNRKLRERQIWILRSVRNE